MFVFCIMGMLSFRSARKATNTHLETPCQELILDLQEVAFAHVHFEGLVDDGEAQIVLDVLPAAVAVRDDAGQQPVVVPPVPDLVLAARRRRALLVQPQRVQLREPAVGDVEHELATLHFEIIFLFYEYYVIVLFILSRV